MDLEDLEDIEREYFPRYNRLIENVTDHEDNESDDERPRQPEIDATGHISSAFIRAQNTEESDSESDTNFEELDMAKITGDCGCVSKCLKQFDKKEIISHIFTMRELSKEDKDMYLMGKLKAKGVDKSTSRYGERKRTRYAYTFDDREVCRDVFLLTHDIGERFLRNLLKHINKNGITPRKHGNLNRRPKNAFSFEEISHVVEFLKNYANLHGLPQPGQQNRHDGEPLILLPACESKKSVFDCYESACQTSGITAVKLTTFKNTWNSCVPNIKFMSIHSDVCNNCKRLREEVSSARTDEDKIEATRKYLHHVEATKRERENYNEWVKKSRDEIDDPDAPRKYVHYTVDFAQSISLPHQTEQVGQIYFLSGRKVKVFGVCMEGKRKQYNYLIDENEGIAKDCTDTKGPNAMISMLDHALKTFNCNETECGIHCDNCGGENKNRFTMGYLAWRVITGQHQKISLMMQFPGHTKCLVDAGFGQAKKLFRRSNCDTVSELAEVFRKSSSSNEVVRYRSRPDDDPNWHWRNWKPFLKEHFNPIPSVKKYYHFTFKSDKPGVVSVKETIDDVEKDVNILRHPLEQFDLLARPEIIPAGGLSRERQQYLYTKVRPYVRGCNRDVFCAAPGEE